MSTLNIQVTYDDNVHQLNLVRENLNWSQLVTVLQSTIPQAVNTNPFVLHYGLDGEAHQVRDQDTFSQLISFPDILGLHFYGNVNQDNMKPVYILPPVNDAFKKLSDFVNVHYTELENNPLLSRAVALLASSMTLSPGNYDDEMKQLENCTKSKGPDCFDAMWKMRNKLMKKQGQIFFKKFDSRHGSHKFSPYFMDRHHPRGFPSAPHQDFDTEFNAFPGSHHRHPFGGRGGHMRGFWGHRGPHSRFDYPSTFFDITSDDEQDGENIPTKINEITPTVYKNSAADESNSDDNEEEDEKFLFELPFGGPSGRPGFGGRGGRGSFGGRGGRFDKHGFGGPGFGGPGFGGPVFGKHGFGGPGFGGPGFERPGFGGPEFEKSDFMGPTFGPGFHGRGRGRFGGRGGSGGRGRGSHRRGKYFGGPGRFEKESVGPDFDFLKSFGHEGPHHMPPSEHKHFYFA